jgi:hypothetical protein
MTRLVPGECRSDEEHRRFHSDDVALDTLDRLEAIVELRRIEAALVTSHRRQYIVEAGWLRERHLRLRRYLNRRDPPPPHVEIA